MSGILFFGYSHVGYHCLDLLLTKGYPVKGVVTHPPTLTLPSLDALADKYQVPVIHTTTARDPLLKDFILSLNPDLILSCYYRFMIPMDILEMAPLGAFNMHGSLLPQYRGRVPINWAILHGEKQTGATLHKMVEKADAGEIVDQEAVTIDYSDHAGSVMDKVVKVSCRILGRQIESLCNGTVKTTSQDLTLGKTFKGRGPQDGLIDWNESSETIYNLIRSVLPFPDYPGAFTYLEGKLIRISQMSKHTGFIDPTALPGTIVDVITPSSFKVICGDHQALDVSGLYEVSCFDDCEIGAALQGLTTGVRFLSQIS